ncbi:MAG: mycothiol synthase [Ilumatobacter sp.]|nr:mycothiol synthase [Ilumatobacter sp.]
MRVVEIARGRADAAATATALRVVTEVAEATGARPISDHLWLDLQGDDEPGPILAIARDVTGPLGVAQVSSGNDAWSMEAFARPGLTDAHDVVLDLVESAVDRFRSFGGGRLFWWVDDPDDADDRLATAHGLQPVRALHEMRRALPHEQTADIETRPFRVGVDDEAWLAVNNRAFANHGEQGGWTTDTLTSRFAEPWFDPDGFRVHEVDGRMAGFCWTKLHADADPPMGEIYVIAVDPEFHGRGLGKQLTLAGLDSISERGIGLANLYVDADNEAAVGLYDRLGFSIHRTRRAYSGDLAPYPDTAPEQSQEPA